MPMILLLLFLTGCSAACETWGTQSSLCVCSDRETYYPTHPCAIQKANRDIDAWRQRNRERIDNENQQKIANAEERNKRLAEFEQARKEEYEKMERTPGPKPLTEEQDKEAKQSKHSISNGNDDICSNYKASATEMENNIKKIWTGIDVVCGCPKSEPWKYPVACTIKCSGNDPRVLHDYQAIGREVTSYFSRKTDFNYMIQVENELMPIAIYFYTIQFDRIDEVFPWQ